MVSESGFRNLINCQERGNPRILFVYGPKKKNTKVRFDRVRERGRVLFVACANKIEGAAQQQVQQISFVSSLCVFFFGGGGGGGGCFTLRVYNLGVGYMPLRLN